MAGAGRRRPREVDAALDAVEAGHDRPLVAVGGGQQHARADQLELEAGRGGAAHLGQPGVDEVGGAAELGGAEPPAWACIRSTTSAGASMRPFSGRRARRRG
jgi:hypothetical protein